MKIATVTICILLVAMAMTYIRYQSLHPCDWMEKDLAQRTGLPRLVVQGRIRAGFLIQGIVDPDTVDCVLAWWAYRAEGLPAER